MERITRKRVQAVLDLYADTLVERGVCTAAEVNGMQLASPYGLVMYVCRYPEGGNPGMPLHDVPGFMGSSGNDGYTSLRAAYDAVQTARRVISQALDPYNVKCRAEDYADNLRRGAEWRAARAKDAAQ